MCEICSKLSVKTPARHGSGVFIFVNLKHISCIFYIIAMIFISTLNNNVLSVFIVNFKAGPQF